MAEYSDLDDKALFDKLQQAELAARLVHSEEWKLLKEAANRIVDRTLERFALKTDPNDLAEIIEIKTLIRKYKYGLFEEVGMLAQEGELYFEELRGRGALNR